MGRNNMYYFDQWGKLKQRIAGVSWNWPAFFVPEIWLAYRKLYAACCLLMLFKITSELGIYVQFFWSDRLADYLTLIDTINTTLIITSLLMPFIIGIWGNYFYLRKTRNSIKKIRAKFDSEATQHEKASEWGGENPRACLIILIISVALHLGLIMFYKFSA